MPYASWFLLTKGLVRDGGRGEGAGFQPLLLKAWADNHLGYWFNTVLLKARNVVLSPDGYLSTPVTMGRAAARWAFTARMSHIGGFAFWGSSSRRVQG